MLLHHLFLLYVVNAMCTRHQYCQMIVCSECYVHTSPCIAICAHVTNTTTHSYPGAGVHVDIGFAVDRHQSIDKTSWDHMMEFISNFIPYLDMEATGSQAGLASFDEISTLDIQLNDHNTTETLQGDIETQPYGGYGRDISVGIFRLRADLFTPEKG